jgi:hypothetical protein
METVRIRDPGWKNQKVGSRIRDKHPGSATLFESVDGFVEVASENAQDLRIQYSTTLNRQIVF